MLLLVVAVSGVVLLGAMWIVGDVEFGTKVVYTVLYGAAWGLLLVDHLLTGVALMVL